MKYLWKLRNCHEQNKGLYACLYTYSVLPRCILTSYLRVPLIIKVIVSFFLLHFLLQFRSLGPLYYRGAEAVMIVYDTINYVSFMKSKDFWFVEVLSKKESDYLEFVNKRDSRFKKGSFSYLYILNKQWQLRMNSFSYDKTNSLSCAAINYPSCSPRHL